MTSKQAAEWLKGLLRLVGAAELLAVIGIFMPVSLMASCHQKLGLGALPDSGVLVYLARTLSGLYMIHGGLLLVVAGDLRRYDVLLSYVIWTGIVFGVLATATGMQAGFPLLWTLGEGPALIVLCLALLWLRKRAGTSSEGEA